MKKNRIWNRLAAIALAGTMLCTLGTPVFATNKPQSLTSVTLTKTVTAGEKVKAPSTSFSFVVSPAEAETGDGGVIKAYAGVQDGMKFVGDQNKITFTSGDSPATPGAASFSKSTEISLDVTKFSTPGIYHYTVSESKGSYDGMTYDSNTYDVYVYVENGADKDLIISAVESKLNGTKGDLSFNNTYTTNKLTLKKVITGNQANKNKEFKFTLTINGAAGEQFTAVNGNSTQILTSGASAIYDLGNNETVVIYGLSATDTYTIEEEDCSKDGYTTTIEGNGTISATNKLQMTGTEGTTDQSVTYTNTKEVSTPTGIVTDVLPYAMMVAFAGGIAVVFLRKRECEG